MDTTVLAHGVGRVYESPLPLSLYLVGAAATVAVSFLIRGLTRDRALPPPRRIVGPGGTRAIVAVLGAIALVTLVLTIVSGIVINSEGLTFPALLFWVGLIVGGVTLVSVLGGIWPLIDPWARIERFYRLEDAETPTIAPPIWLGPLMIYALFWFELVSGAGFDTFWVVAVLIVYSLFVFSFRPRFGDRWDEVDPLSILFGFASRTAPLRVTADGIDYKGPVRDLAEERAMPLTLFLSVFVLLGSTTLDNVRETVGWSEMKVDTGLDALPNILLDSIALGAFALPFAASFYAAMWVAHRWIGKEMSLTDLARRFAWSLIPIGIAYVLSHNAPLLISSVPYLIQGLSDPFARGWNLFGTAELFQGFVASPSLVWFLEIALIVAGHIVAVLTGHRVAVDLARSRKDAVKSQYALTLLMAAYTITTLWLLSQPLVD